MKDTSITKPFIGAAIVRDDALGLPKETWYHFVYLPHFGGDGYANEIAIPYADSSIYVRGSGGNTWLQWRKI